MTTEIKMAFRAERLVHDRIRALRLEYDNRRFVLTWTRSSKMERPLLVLKVANTRLTQATRCWLMRLDPVDPDVQGKGIPKPTKQERTNIETLAILRFNLGDLL